jgi:hypothetical protein
VAKLERGGDLTRAAQEWADRGWSVFPCLPTKRPATPNGFHDATRDAEKIDRHDWPMIGGVPASAGLVVFDVDVQNGASLADLPAEWIETRRHRTTSGGWHLIFTAEPGVDYGNGPHPDYPGCDVRHGSGYVILPPSPGYWLENEGVEPLPAPAELAKRTLSAPNGNGPNPETPTELEPIPRGRQDDALKEIARRLYRDGLDREAVKAALRSTITTRCIDTDPTNPWGELDVERLSRPVPDSLAAKLNRGELDNYAVDELPARPSTSTAERRLRLLSFAELDALPPVAMLHGDMLVERGFQRPSRAERRR